MDTIIHQLEIKNLSGEVWKRRRLWRRPTDDGFVISASLRSRVKRRQAKQNKQRNATRKPEHVSEREARGHKRLECAATSLGEVLVDKSHEKQIGQNRWKIDEKGVCSPLDFKPQQSSIIQRPAVARMCIGNNFRLGHFKIKSFHNYSTKAEWIVNKNNSTHKTGQIMSFFLIRD